MKRYFSIGIITAFLLSNAALLQGATGTATQPTPGQTVNVPASTPYTITVQDGNSRRWEQTTYQVDPSGQVFSKQHSYTELATGLNHLVNGQWVESKEEIDIQPNGTASATQGQHQAYFPGDIYNGEIELVTPDGVQLHSRPIGLSYFDGQNSVLIAELKDSTGVVSGNNQVIYPDAFTDFKADLVYTYTKAGLEQDIVLREQPPTPESFGLDSQNTRLQVLTEFFDTANPIQTAVVVNHKDGLSDTTLAFGQMKMVQGKAFAIGDTDPVSPNTRKFPIYKSWQILNGRTFLVEELPVQRIATQLEQLPMPASAGATVSSAQSVLHKVSATRLLPPTRLAQTGTNTMQLARVEPNHKSGLVLDYVTLNSVSGDLTFQGDTTYYISSPLASFGTVTVEGGTVVKFDPYSYLLMYDGAVVCKTAPYRPAILTSKNDNTVGETITGSTGSPTAVWPTFAMDSSLSGSTTGMVVHDIRFCYMCNGIGWSSEGDGPYNVDIWNCQFVNCIEGFNVDYYLNVGFHNVLFSGCTTAVGNNADADSYTVTAEQVTADVGSFGQTPDPSWMTNSIILESSGPTATLIGNSVITTSPALPLFQTAGGGRYYLTNNSTYRNAGTTNISPALLAELRQKTTYPPNVYSNIPLSVATTLSSQVQRDTDIPDLGYHYDPIDYAVGGVDVFTSLNVTNGAVIGWFESQNDVYSSGQGYGVSLNDGSSLSFQGTATLPCWMVKYDTVQEGPWTASGWMGGIMINGSSSGIKPQLNGRFAKFSGLADDSNHYRDNWAYGTSSFADCEFYISGIAAYDQSSLIFTNCLFFRDGVYFASYAQPIAQNFTFQNCLFYDGFIAMTRYTGQPATLWTIKDTAFDGTGFSTTDNYSGNPTYTALDYNAYNTNNQSGLSYPYPYTPVPTNRLENIGTHDVPVGTYNWQTNWLGNYYQPTSSPLINMGSTNANLVGLYHYTTQTNQVPETNSVVDIGYHYVATDSSGNPSDTLWFGIPDYLADTNGELAAWEMNYFGHLGLDPTGDADNDGINNLQEYENGSDPNGISFSFSVTNQYVSTSVASGVIAVSGGVPSSIAVLVDSTNFSTATWSTYTSSNITVSLGSTQGMYDVWIGLRGLPADATPTWQSSTVTLYAIAPTLTITNPTTSTVSQSTIQLQGYASNPLAGLTFDVSNAAGIFTNQDGFLTGQFYDTNLLAYTTNYFECNADLSSGTNLITLHAIDWAGNTTNVSITLDYVPDTNPPVLNVIWPQDGTQISGSNFTVQAQVSDATVTVTASVNGNMVLGLVEQNGSVWVNSLALIAGTNAVTLTASNIFGGVSITNFNVVGNDVGLTIDPISTDQMNEQTVIVTGKVNDSTDKVTVNTITATVHDDGTWEADNVPVNPTGTATLDVEVSDASSHPLASQTANQPQPATVVLAGYSGVQNIHTSNPGWGAWTINWAYDSGGTADFSGFDPNNDPGTQNQYGDSSYAADGPGFATPGFGADFFNIGGGLTWDYFSVNTSFSDEGETEYFQRTSRAQTMIVPAGQEPAGGTDVYVVLTSAMAFSNPAQELLFGEGPGDTPIAPETLQVNDQAPVNTGITNDDGSVSGATLVTGKAGKAVPLKTTATAMSALTFNDQTFTLGLKIIDAGSGTDLTAQTNNVIVGQQMNMFCRLSITNQFMTNFPIANFQWTVPGITFSDYVATAESAVLYTNFPTGNSNIMFCWSDGGLRQVQISAVVKGQPITGKAWFNVLKPTAQIITEGGTVALDFYKSAIRLHCGDIFGTVGMLFNVTNFSVPSQFAENTNISWFQVVTSQNRQQQSSSGTWYQIQGTNLCDTTCPYPFDIGFFYPITADSPASTNLVDYIAVNYSDSFDMYLMYQPNGGKLVPLQKVSWHWDGAGSWNGANWTLTSHNNPGSPSGSDTTIHPTWTGNVVDLQWQPE